MNFNSAHPELVEGLLNALRQCPEPFDNTQGERISIDGYLRIADSLPQFRPHEGVHMKLYYSPGSCSLSPHIALREAGLSVELQKVDLGTKALSNGGAFTTINTKGYVPALELPNGELLTEGPAIVQYIADQNADSKLAPKAGTLERYRLVEWLNFITSELHKSFSPLFNKAASDDWKAAATANIGKRFDYVSDKLKGKQYLMGDTFTVADGYLFTVLGWTKYVGFDLSKWPTLVEYAARVAARPKVQEALKAEGLLG
jgi:glutathione S-transferase